MSVTTMFNHRQIISVSLFNMFNMLINTNVIGPIWIILGPSLCIDYTVKLYKITVILFGFMLPNL